MPGVDVRFGATVDARAEVILGRHFLLTRIAGQFPDQLRDVITARSGDTFDVHPQLAGCGVDGELDLRHDQSVADAQLDEAALGCAVDAAS